MRNICRPYIGPNVNENEECRPMRTVHMIRPKELSEGVEGFSKDEICDILNNIIDLPHCKISFYIHLNTV